jgi:uncharacterized protein (TIGR03435 family)
MSRISASVLPAVALLLAPAVHPQSPSGAASTPRFDAASIKRLAPGTPRPSTESLLVPPRQHGRYTDPYTTLGTLLRRAYDVRVGLVVGPEWLDSETYSVAATMPPETTDAQVRLMLQNLVEERFQVKVLFETRDTPVYALTVGKNGPKLNTAVAGRPSRLRGTGTYRFECTNTPMEALAGFFSLKAHGNRYDGPVGQIRLHAGLVRV